MTDAHYTHEHLVALGFRIQSSGDLAFARWIVKQVGAERAAAAAHTLRSRRPPRPARVAAELGLGDTDWVGVVHVCSPLARAFAARRTDPDGTQGGLSAR